MENLPASISVLFVLITALTVFFLFQAFRQSKLVLVISVAWLCVQGFIAATGFYQKTYNLPPRFLALVLPPLAFIAVVFMSSTGRRWIEKSDARWLTRLHVVRVPVEISLLLLFLHHQVPQLMTFEGRNFDIFSGITAPAVAYFGYTKTKWPKPILLAWNILCLLLLFNIVTLAILSVPTPFQKLAFDQPNIAVLYFPFVWLPCFVVPAVLLSHLIAIKQLLLKKPTAKHSESAVRAVSVASND